MINSKIFYSIFLFSIFFSCKQNKQADQKAMINMESKKLKRQQKIDLKDLVKSIAKGNSPESKISVATVQEIIHDLNGDGIKDKIEVYKNTSLNDKFDQEHFHLPIKIFKGTNSGFKLWKENNNLIYSVDNTCASEGFSNIVVKNNYFTIEAQTCYDYNVLVNGFTTFKIENNEIFYINMEKNILIKAIMIKKYLLKSGLKRISVRSNFRMLMNHF